MAFTITNNELVVLYPFLDTVVAGEEREASYSFNIIVRSVLHVTAEAFARFT